MPTAAGVECVRAARGPRFEDTLVTAMIESTAAVENLPGILAVEGLDAVVVGLSDLAYSLGYPGADEHPEVRRAADRVIAAARLSNRIMMCPQSPYRGTLTPRGATRATSLACASRASTHLPGAPSRIAGV